MIDSISRWAVATLAVSLLVACNSPLPHASNQESQESAVDSILVLEEDAVKAAVDSFLVAIGNYDLEALRPMFVSNANIGSVRLSEGTWQTTTYSFEEFYSRLQSRPNPVKYQEPVSHYTVHVERGGLAFVRADATLMRDGQARSNNIDYFILVKDDGIWRFLSASYVAYSLSND
jgi:ketosteroid isomerase-like protein